MDTNSSRAALLHVFVRRAEKEAERVRPWAGRVPFVRIVNAAERLADPHARGQRRQEGVSGACTVEQLDKLLGTLPSVKRERRADGARRRRAYVRIVDEHIVLQAFDDLGEGLKFYEVAASVGFEDPEHAYRILMRLQKAGVVVDNGDLGWFRAPNR